MIENYITKKSLATLFSVSVRTVERWCQRGVPCLPIGTSGRDRRFKPSEVEEWLKVQSEVSKR